ncbi:uL15 family ribosomal protein [Candidatus Woesearchaeota archaeon]|nr:uL15 family ribosomal protein [Candidatus Woesearchaeota archaeon]
MTVNKRKKSNRYRGSKTHGCGAMKKRRGAGNKGGRGMAGSGKRADSKKPSLWGERYFGKFGFKSKSTTDIRPVNIEYLEANIGKLSKQNVAVKENDVYSVDLEKLGFNKLLGSGKVLNKYRIKVSYASKKAIEKVKGSGGEVILAVSAGKKQ